MPPSPETYLPQSTDRLTALFGRLDSSFADTWQRHITRLLSRPQLDVRTRFLVMTSQYTITRMPLQLEENTDAGIEAGVQPAHLLEAILQCYVYAGPWVVASACEVFERVVARHDIVEPSGASPTLDADRSLAEERATWSDADEADPRVEDFITRYGWHGLSNGLRLRPGHHINLVDTLDALDGDFLGTWLDSVYDGMYGRQVLDDRIRLLCVVGATLALGEAHQSRRHMRAALRSGAEPAELLEVIFQTTALFGHPHVMPAAIDDLIRILDDEGRLEELADPGRIDDLRRIVAARVSRRGSVQDDLSGS